MKVASSGGVSPDSAPETPPVNPSGVADKSVNPFGVASLRDAPVRRTPKQEPKLKIKELLETISPPAERQTKQMKPFQKPTSEEEWRSFHKMNEEGMKKAYESKEGYFKDGNKLYVAGTRDFQDVLDWPKIPLGIVRKSKIYKNIEPVFKEDKAIDYVVGHSAGGSATLELERNFPEGKITSVTYNAPVFKQADMDKLLDEDKKAFEVRYFRRPCFNV